MPELTPLDNNRQEHFLNGEDLEPITRREHFYAGRESELPAGHQEPETREEWFIQKYRGGGGDVTVVPLSVTENGTYSEEGKAYSPVSVNVPLPQNAYLLKSVSNLPQPIASFNDGEDMVMPSLKVAIEPQQEGSGDPSPTNIRPISGWDEVNVTRTGKNLFDIHIDKDTTATTITLVKPIVGYISVSAINNNIEVSESVWRIGVVLKNGATYYIGDEGYDYPFPRALYGTEENPIVQIKYRSNTIISGSYDVQIELGDTPTTYEQYNGQTITIDLDGTRYGGSLDVVSGVLTVDRAFLSNDYLVNTASYESAGRGCFALIGITLKSMGSNVVDTKLMASALKTSSQNDLYTNKNIGIAHWWNTRIGFSTGDETITTVSAFKQWLTDNGSDVVYELATPLTIQLTPTQVKSLLGVNNVWADTGNIEVVEYFSKEV